MKMGQFRGALAFYRTSGFRKKHAATVLRRTGVFRPRKPRPPLSIGALVAVANAVWIVMRAKTKEQEHFQFVETAGVNAKKDTLVVK